MADHSRINLQNLLLRNSFKNLKSKTTTLETMETRTHNPALKAVTTSKNQKKVINSKTLIISYSKAKIPYLALQVN
jgi:CMP-2-keto-3-deoxyoctulosonic acid synthetase